MGFDGAPRTLRRRWVLLLPLAGLASLRELSALLTSQATAWAVPQASLSRTASGHSSVLMEPLPSSWGRDLRLGASAASKEGAEAEVKKAEAGAADSDEGIYGVKYDDFDDEYDKLKAKSEEQDGGSIGLFASVVVGIIALLVFGIYTVNEQNQAFKGASGQKIAKVQASFDTFYDDEDLKKIST
mmetsp:Transcript_36056/g.78807  ORF Transcript_36056/g.78807 Transcript_36056/m.78807 type:complete len:185 (-) Transcript_36056:83-637(-)|eukprot:CAMPEP_0170599036 /NCGR_PEP_ID=MMETSP0224-20130122/16572_1 /TAXON_ID=285029 /ORGANISM="Togula jolla, Strain CCCM 725" /LENGTH=184 /DNA_ID=CAMNT_0010923639 /DNA_START=41 /DNA_END=595 /DNA_ORIENTATION=+